MGQMLLGNSLLPQFQLPMVEHAGNITAHGLFVK
jgi:hypothetical protein